MFFRISCLSRNRRHFFFLSPPHDGCVCSPPPPPETQPPRQSGAHTQPATPTLSLCSKSGYAVARPKPSLRNNRDVGLLVYAEGCHANTRLKKAQAPKADHMFPLPQPVGGLRQKGAGGPGPVAKKNRAAVSAFRVNAKKTAGRFPEVS